MTDVTPLEIPASQTGTAQEEALDYYQRFHDLIAADADDELALSEKLAQRPSPRHWS